MSEIKRSDVLWSVERILGKQHVEAMSVSHVGLPRMMSLAAERAFVANIQGDEADTLRAGLLFLDKHGYLPR